MDFNQTTHSFVRGTEQFSFLQMHFGVASRFCHQMSSMKWWMLSQRKHQFFPELLLSSIIELDFSLGIGSPQEGQTKQVVELSGQRTVESLCKSVVVSVTQGH